MLENNVEQDIEIAIKQHLPAMVGAQLVNELNELKRLREVEELYKAIRDEKKILSDELSKHESLDKRYEQLFALEETIRKREFELELTLAKASIENLKENNKNVLSLVNVIFKNPVTTRSINGVAPAGVGPTYQGGPAVGLTACINQVETVQQE